MDLVFRLRGSVKTYEWGKHGLKSAVAFLQNADVELFVVDEETPYAELWIGTHSSGPSLIPSMHDMLLSDWLLNHPQCLGRNITKRFGKTHGLPFLFKVLSVNKPLSIQAHPDIKTARRLHREFPDRYPDSNHKPEMAIALTPFEALCGFRPLSEIKSFFKDVPQLRDVVGPEVANQFLFSPGKKKLKKLFTAVMTCPPEEFQPYLVAITKSFKKGRLGGELLDPIRDIFLRTVEQYPGDVGCFCLFFLNHIKLTCGEAIFLAANEPHAYLFGDCLECMACSDNVVRAGLTPKFRDVETLLEMLTYESRCAGENIYLPGHDDVDRFIRIYNPPVDEFGVVSIALLESESENGIYKLEVIHSASVLIIIKGNGSYIKADDNEEVEFPMSSGSIIFISSGVKLHLKWSTDVFMFRAYCPP